MSLSTVTTLAKPPRTNAAETVAVYHQERLPLTGAGNYIRLLIERWDGKYSMDGFYETRVVVVENRGGLDVTIERLTRGGNVNPAQ